jgi:signal peptidase II
MEGSWRGYSRLSNPFVRLGGLVALLTLVLDQAAKFWLLNVFDIARRGAVAVTPFFDLVLAWNTGISYGLFQGDGAFNQIVLSAIKIVAVIALVVWLVRAGSKLVALCLGLIIGGALGNAIDRLTHGAVVDFALFHVNLGGHTFNWYVFNLADVAIVAGVTGLLYDAILGHTPQKRPDPQQ